jgi:hypothetical protein
MFMAKKITHISEIHVHAWAPDAYLASEEQETYGIPKIFSIPTIPGRKRWLISLPACVLKPDSSTLTLDVETRLVQAALAQRRETPLVFFKPRKETTDREGRSFYSAFFLEQVGPFLALPATVAALAAFVRAADQKQAKVGKILPRNPEELSGLVGRGRLWQPWEDTVIRNWFGRRTYGEHQGQHVPLTEEQWQTVLETHLRGRRTREQVKVRITTLNRVLRVSLLVDGFLPRDKVREFQDRSLGEHRVRVPRFRPRIKGRSYRGDHERPVLGQPD